MVSMFSELYSKTRVLKRASALKRPAADANMGQFLKKLDELIGMEKNDLRNDLTAALQGSDKYELESFAHELVGFLVQ